LTNSYVRCCRCQRYPSKPMYSVRTHVVSLKENYNQGFRELLIPGGHGLLISTNPYETKTHLPSHLYATLHSAESQESSRVIPWRNSLVRYAHPRDRPPDLCNIRHTSVGYRYASAACAYKHLQGSYGHGILHACRPACIISAGEESSRFAKYICEDRESKRK